MLILSRKPDQSIQIGTASLHILAVKGKTVKIAITAPRHIRILRGELRNGQPRNGRHKEPHMLEA